MRVFFFFKLYSSYCFQNTFFSRYSVFSPQKLHLVLWFSFHWSLERGQEAFSMSRKPGRAAWWLQRDRVIVNISQGKKKKSRVNCVIRCLIVLAIVWSLCARVKIACHTQILDWTMKPTMSHTIVGKELMPKERGGGAGDTTWKTLGT